jgi:hypothetical protein
MEIIKRIITTVPFVSANPYLISGTLIVPFVFGVNLRQEWDRWIFASSSLFGMVRILNYTQGFPSSNILITAHCITFYLPIIIKGIKI